MILSHLNSYCTEHMLLFLSMKDVSIFSEMFPEHQEAVNTYWRKLLSVDVATLTSGDLGALLQNITSCKNLKELKLGDLRTYESMEPLLNAAARHCPALQVIDISTIDLTAARASFLKHCHNLKSLSVRVPYLHKDYPRRGLLADGIQLEHLGVIGVEYLVVEAAPSVNHPKASIQIDPYLWKGHSDPKLDRCIRKEMRRIFNSGVFFLESINKTQRSLKSLSIYNSKNMHVCRLLARNRFLQDVTIESKRVEECLPRLPPGLKHLDISPCLRVYLPAIVLAVERWQLESLKLNTGSLPMDFLDDLVPAVAATLQHITLYCSLSPIVYLGNLENLKLLKTLRVIGLAGHYTEDFRRIITRCGNLEVLEINGKRLYFDEDLLGSIAAHPTLRELDIFSIDEDPVSDIQTMMSLLSTSLSLTSISLFFGTTFTDDHVITLISGSSILTDLKLIGRNLTKEFIPKVKEVLTMQTDRKDVLNLNFSGVPFFSKDIRAKHNHPLLKANFWN